MKKLFVAIYNGKAKTTRITELECDLYKGIKKEHEEEYVLNLKDFQLYLTTYQGLDEVYHILGLQNVKLKTGHTIILPQLDYVLFISDNMERVNKAIDKLPAEWTSYVNFLKEEAYLNIN